MKVTFVLPNRSTTGGVRVVYEYAGRLSRRGHEVMLITPIVPPRPVRLLREVGVTTLARKALRGSAVDWTTAATQRTVPTLNPHLLRRVVPDEGPVVAPSWRTVGPVAALDRREADTYHLLQHYEAWGLWNSRECWRRAERIADERGEPVQVAMARIDTSDLDIDADKAAVDDALSAPLRPIPVSGWLTRLAEEVFDQQSEGIVTHGVDRETFHPGIDGDTGPPTVLAPYREATWKGAEDAVEAFRRIRATTDDVRFEMFGPVAADLPDWIDYHENVSDGALRRLYARADVFVFPSWTEGFGLPPMEAMACGCATVSTEVGAVPDYATPGETVETVSPRAPGELADATVALLEDEGRRRAMTEAASEQMADRSWRNATDQLEAILRGDSDA